MLSNNDAILILGCHRSGTSALSAVLHSCGYELPGGEVDTGCHENPAGYYENRAVVHANNRILNALGFGWDSPVAIENLLTSSDEKFFMRTIRQVVQMYFEKTGYVIKDPRMSTLWPLWLNALMESNAGTIKLIIAMRNPMKVSESLIRRHRRSPEGCRIGRLQDGYNFWESQTISALKAALYLDFKVVDTDSFIRRPRDSMHEIENSLNLGLSSERINMGVDIFETKIRRKELYVIASESEHENTTNSGSAFELYRTALQVRNHDDLIKLLKDYDSHS